MMIHRTSVLAAALAALTLAPDGTAQRFGRRGRPPEAAPQAAPQPEKPAEPKKVESWTVIQGGDVYVGDGTVLRRTHVVLADDKIHAVGQEVEIPEGATIVDATGKVVAPGFCLPMASGFGAPGGGSDVREGLNPFDPTIKMGLAAGITSFLWTSGSGTGTPGGNSAVVKLAYGDLEGMVCVENTTVAMRVPLSAQDLSKFRDLVEQARKHQDAVKEAAGKPDAKPPAAPKGTEEILKVMSGEKRLWIAGGGGGFRFPGMGGGSGSRGFDQTQIRQAMEIATLLGVGVVLDRPIEAWAIADEVAATGSMAVVSPRQRVESDEAAPETTGSNIAQSAILHAAGVPVAVTTPAGRFGGSPSIGTGGIMGQDLNTPHVDAAFAVRGGMPNRAALRTLTLDSAKIANAERRVGSIEAGKDADILILDGDPLHYKTFVETALVNGKVVYRKDDEPYYRHIRR
jgi:hypothetical protein